MERFDVLIVGGGHAGVALVGQLRKSGHQGRIGVLEAQAQLPYERPPLSKGYMLGEVGGAELLLRQAEYWAGGAAELLTAVTVTQIDPVGHTVTTADGRVIGYGALVWAAGAAARRLELPGADARNVVSVRTLEDAQRLAELTRQAKHAVLIGGGYIGLETASTLSKLGLCVTVLEAADRLLARVAGPVLAGHLQQAHEARGVRVVTRARIAAIETDGDRATAVMLENGERLPADIMVVGVGVAPRVEVLSSAGAEVSNGVVVDEACRSTLPDVYAVGDIASQRNSYFLGGERLRLESVPNVTEHARFVAADLLGQPIPERGVPWFWSNQYEFKLQTAGILTGFDEEVIREQTDHTLVVGYFKEGILLAADTIGAPKDFNAVKAILGRGISITPADFANREAPLTERLRPVLTP
ncbi:NAD(P)/FAD-dependent oxidoreductase [Sinomonas sp. G460-2]|uniref:NAD(P)/FAD-dependent oxidoreductase n=1 Tax=Sinomonas sp. G460-2 TaxID=3393464 RepID=UPI0039EE2C5F